MSETVKRLLEKRDQVEVEINELENRWHGITDELCTLEGHCPHCRNWHYPHCGDTPTTDTPMESDCE